MSVTPEFVKKELSKLEKKRQANETTRKEAREALDRADQINLGLQREEVALRTLAAGGIPKAARAGLAQQLAEVLKVSYDETSIMEIIAKYEKQDTTEPVEEAPAPKKSAAPAPAPKAAASATPVGDAPKKGRGRPKLTDEQKAENARKRALAAAAAAVEPEMDEDVEEPMDGVDPDEEFFDPDKYDQE